MKKKFVLPFLAGLCLIIVTVGVVMFFGKTHKSSKITSMEYSISGFAGIEIEGAWDVVIEKSYIYGIKIQISESDMKDLVVEKKENVLDIAINKSFFSFDDSTYKKTISITMPQLKYIGSSGSSRIMVKGFESEELKIRNAGSGIVIGEKSRIDKLLTYIAGSADIDFFEAEVKNANVDILGSGKLRLNMTGGDLTGTINGSSDIIYRGTVKIMNIHELGSSSVKKVQ